MNINSRYPVRHKLLLAGSGERAAVTLTRVAAYRRSPRGSQRRPIIRSNARGRDQSDTQPRTVQCWGGSRRRGPVVILPMSDFQEVTRAAGPKGQTPKTPRTPRTPRALDRKDHPWNAGMGFRYSDCARDRQSFPSRIPTLRTAEHSVLSRVPRQCNIVGNLRDGCPFSEAECSVWERAKSRISMQR